MASQTTRKRVTDSPVIPDRLYFKIGDVARLCGVEPYVLRFWETQFPQLKRNKSGPGQESNARPGETPKRSEAVTATVSQIRAELREIVSLLSTHQPRPPRPRG